MGQLTAQQLNALSVQFREIANTILDYRIAHPLLPADDADLEMLQNSILDSATALATQSAIQAGSEAAEAIKTLINVTGEIKTTIKGLENVTKVINIAAAVLKVAVCLTKVDFGGIKNGVKDLVDSLKN